MKVFVEAIFKKIKRKRLLSKNKGQCNVFDGFHTDKKDLFILGTGPSVNNIEDGKFDIIKNNGYSVGMNLWTMHDFIPDCYSIEGMRNFDLANIQKGLLSRVEIARHKPLFLVHNPWEKGVLSYFKDELIDNVMVYTSIFIGLKKRNLNKFMKKLAVTQNILFDTGFVSVDVSSSLSRIISIALKGNFNRIILIGIDLNVSGAFYDNNEELLKRRGLPVALTNYEYGALHPTMDKSVRMHTIVDAVNVFKLMAERNGTQILVENSESQLATILPVYKWD